MHRSSTLLFAAFLLSPVHGADFESKSVSVELRNGSRIDGLLIGEEGGAWVIGVGGGEVRFKKGSVLRIVPKVAGDEGKLPVPGGAPAGPKTVRIELPPPAPLSFEVPESLTERKLEGRDLALVDPTGSFVFGVSTASDAHSLWSFTRAIKKDYGSLYPRFCVEREKISAANGLTSWELEFRYEKKS